MSPIRYYARALTNSVKLLVRELMCLVALSASAAPTVSWMSQPPTHSEQPNIVIKGSPDLQLAEDLPEEAALAEHTVDWVECDAQKALAVYRVQHNDHAVIVAVNFGNTDQNINLDLTATHPWRDILNDRPVPASSHLRITLPAGNCGVWATQE